MSDDIAVEEEHKIEMVRAASHGYIPCPTFAFWTPLTISISLAFRWPIMVPQPRSARQLLSFGMRTTPLAVL
jgi:hypothetical protein